MIKGKKTKQINENYFAQITSPQSILPGCVKLLLNSIIDLLDFMGLVADSKLVCHKNVQSLSHGLSTLRVKGRAQQLPFL